MSRTDKVLLIVLALLAGTHLAHFLLDVPFSVTKEVKEITEQNQKVLKLIENQMESDANWRNEIRRADAEWRTKMETELTTLRVKHGITMPAETSTKTKAVEHGR